MPDRLTEIRNAIDTFDTERARELLREAFKDEATAETYYLASLVALNDTQRKTFLQQAVDLDPFHKEATEELAKLQPSEWLSEGNKPPSAVTPKPKPEIEIQPKEEKQKEEEPQFVIGTIVYDTCPLIKIPHDDGVLVTELPEDAQVIPLTRDEELEWLNVLYIGSTGRELVGWVEIEDVEDLRLGEKTVRAMDLPITKYEWNTRADIKQLAEMKLRELNKKSWENTVPPLILTGGSFVGFFLSLVLDTADLFPLAASGFGIGFVWLMIQLVINGQRYKPLQDEGKNLKELAKTDQDRQVEQQIKMAAINTALQVGGNVITRSTPDRKVVTQKNR